MKILMIVLDGLGDRVYAELGGMTPLEYAKTPNLDIFASKSMCGNLYALGPGLRPSSDVAHMELFGIDHNIYYTGRGPIELAGLNIPFGKNDIAFRGNFVVKDSANIIVDRRAKRQAPEKDVLQCLRKVEIDKTTFELYHIAEHRFALKVSGSKVDPHICDSDPHIENVSIKRIEATIDSENARYTADIMNRYVDYVNSILLEKGSSSNSILLRGAGIKPKWYSFKEKYDLSAACIANNALYNGIGSLLQMNVLHSKYTKNYKEYYNQIQHIIDLEAVGYDFVFLHLQEGDLFGEDGNVTGKVCAIEEMDKALAFINELPEDIVVAITSDHSTPCCLRAHSGDAVALAIYGPNCRKDQVVRFSERTCYKGILGTVLGKDFLRLVLDAAGRSVLIGG